jgi:hypothetical protein
MRVLGTLGKALESMFLRIYAKNLSRSFRGEPANACTDSEIQMTTMILLSVGALFLIVGSLLFPNYLRQFVNGGSSSIAVLLVMTIGVAFSVHARFGRFERTPQLAQAYKSPKSRLGARLAYWAIGLAWLVIAILTLAHKRS